MKKEGRVTLLCEKSLSCGVVDRFTVVVADKSVSDAKQMYKSMGYEVKEND